MKRETDRKGKKQQQNATDSASRAREASAARERLMKTLLDPDHRMKSVTKICSIAKIDRATYYRAFENEDFRERYREKAKALATHLLGPAMNALNDQAQMGNMQAIKMIAEMNGIYTEKREVGTPPGQPIEIKALMGMSAEALEKLAE